SDVVLPQVAAPVLADAVEALSPRLRKRLDDTLTKAAAWAVGVDGAAGTVTVTVDEDTHVVLTLRDGVVRAAEDAVCSCLLAPACLHRAAVLGLAPVWDEEVLVAAQVAEMPAETPAETPAEVTSAPDDEPASLSPDQAAAAEALRI